MRKSLVLAPLAMFALANAALAGGADCKDHAKNAALTAKKEGCSASQEECAKHFQEARNKGWLGIQYDSTDDGTSVIESVVKGSPAEKAGFRPGDVLVALNGIEINEANMAQVKTTWKSLKPGSVANYTVKRDGVAKDLTATLAKMPEDVYQAMVSDHMKKAHVDVAAK